MVNLKMLIYDVIIVVYVLIGIAVFVPWILLSIDSADPLFLYISNEVVSFFSYFCHQMGSRSFFFDDIKQPVCSRCASIYVATALGMIFFRAKGFGTREFKMNYLLLVMLFLPTAIDGLTQMFGWRLSTNELRLVTGVPYGLGYAYLMTWTLPLVYGLIELISVTVKNEDYKPVVVRLKKMIWPPI